MSKKNKKEKQLYLVRTQSDQMGGKPNMVFTYDISGVSDTPWITIYEVRELTEKERKTISKK